MKRGGENAVKIKKIPAPYVYLMLIFISLQSLIRDYESKPIWITVFAIFSILGLSVLTYLDRDKFFKK
ncbi:MULTISPECIES: hypothetical protein [unclassified Lysinibacillus]|uniref:hypothetical protein n=1 Tax=unclassified Lysinibacillus TaxID=2636778 RepID=UPI00381DE9C1